MAAGHIVNGQCVDAAASLDFYWGSQHPVTTYFSTYVDFQVFNKTASGWALDTYLHSGSLPTLLFKSSKPVPVINFGVCDYQATKLPADFDYTMLGALWAFSFSVVVALFLLGRSGGAIINIFKPR